MKTSLSILFASTALTIALAIPALATMHPQGRTGMCSGGICAAVSGDSLQSTPIIHVSDTDSKGDDGDRISSRRDDDCDEDGGNDGDDDCIGAGTMQNPAPAGTVAPPANGLFGKGSPPVAVTN